MVDVTTVQRFECPRCGTPHPDEYEALACCVQALEEVTLFVCGECSEEHAYEDNAEACCEVDDEE